MMPFLRCFLSRAWYGKLIGLGEQTCLSFILAKDSEDHLAHARLRALGALATESKRLEAPQVQFVETAKPRKSP